MKNAFTSQTPVAAECAQMVDQEEMDALRRSAASKGE